MSISRVIDFPERAGVLPSYDFMINGMAKMPWMLWMELSWTEESSECKWRVMEDPQMVVVVAEWVAEAETVEGGGPTQDLVPVLAQEIATVVIVAAQDRDPLGDHAAENHAAEAAAVAETKSS